MKTLLMATVLGASLFTATVVSAQQPATTTQQPAATAKPTVTKANMHHATKANVAHKHATMTKKTTETTPAKASPAVKPVAVTPAVPAKVATARPASPKPTTAPVKK